MCQSQEKSKTLHSLIEDIDMWKTNTSFFKPRGKKEHYTFTVQRTQPGPPKKPTLWNLKKCSRFWLVYKLPKPDSFVANMTCDWLINVGWPRLSSLHCNITYFLFKRWGETSTLSCLPLGGGGGGNVLHVSVGAILSWRHFDRKPYKLVEISIQLKALIHIFHSYVQQN